MKKQKLPTHCWRIRGFDGTAEIFNQTGPVQQMSESGLKALLQALAARHLTPPEVVAAYAKRGAQTFRTLLEVHTENQIEKRRALYTCGENPHYIATVEKYL